VTFPKDIHLFCRVVDNFGDIGVCWRLAKQFTREYAVDVTLWVDDLSSFHTICNAIDPQRDIQVIQGIKVMHWRQDVVALNAAAGVDAVIEAFGCELPPTYIAAMAARNRKPVWINLEYLSAESWVEDCHMMQSLYPSLPLTKYFFFPGFSNKTGGLLMENDLTVRRIGFQNCADATNAFLESIGIRFTKEMQKISLFCYKTAPVEALFDELQADCRPAICIVPQGVAFDAISAFLQQPAVVGATATRGGLTVKIVPFLDQVDYDKLLWACDLNFVRGEDSLVRAQWAGRPFLWHIYPQNDDVHLVKLRAFLEVFTAHMPDETRWPVIDASFAWNGVGEFAVPWQKLGSELPDFAPHMNDWIGRLQNNGNLAANLIEFIRKIG
jgi:uncharacterized repeat protein (TIGR03837 family)